jgi:hypothetical protein
LGRPLDDAKTVFDAASESLGIEDLDAYFLHLRRSIGSPWGKDHRVAMAAAIIAAAGSTEKPGK